MGQYLPLVATSVRSSRAGGANVDPCSARAADSPSAASGRATESGAGEAACGPYTSGQGRKRLEIVPHSCRLRATANAAMVILSIQRLPCCLPAPFPSRFLGHDPWPGFHAPSRPLTVAGRINLLPAIGRAYLSDGFLDNILGPRFGPILAMLASNLTLSRFVPSIRYTVGYYPKNPVPPGSKTYHHGDLRKALIEAGLTIVEQEGIEQVSLRAVARRVAVSHSA